MSPDCFGAEDTASLCQARIDGRVISVFFEVEVCFGGMFKTQ